MIALLVAKNEFIRSLKDKKKLVLIILVPLISIIVAMGANSLMKPSIKIGIIENDYSPKDFNNNIETLEEIKVLKANKETINTDMILAKYLGVIEFKENNEFEVYCLDKNIKLDLRNSINEVIEKGETNKLQGLLNLLEEGTLSVAQRGSGFIFIPLIITCTLSSIVLLKDKKDKVLERYSTSPNKLSSYILGNYIYNTINSIFQVVISILLIYLLKINTGIYIYEFIIIGIIIAIASSSIALLITVISNGELQASLLASSIALIMALFGGAFLPIEKMPDTLKVISNLSITKWIIDFVDSIDKGIVYGENLIFIMIIIFLSLGVAFISVKVGEKKLI